MTTDRTIGEREETLRDGRNQQVCERERKERREFEKRKEPNTNRQGWGLDEVWEHEDVGLGEGEGEEKERERGGGKEWERGRERGWERGRERGSGMGWEQVGGCMAYRDRHSKEGSRHFGKK